MVQPKDIEDLSKLSVHTQTNRPWDLRECVENYEREGIRRISVWRHLLEEISLADAKMLLDDHGMEVSALVRGGFFASVERTRRVKAIEDNLLAIEQAAAIGAPMVVLVCGSDPGQSLETSRAQIREGIGEIIPRAERAGIRLAIEPLHPMFAGDKSAITTMSQANDLVQSINSDFLGVAVDVFHVWWDPSLRREIHRCGEMEKLFAFHLCDWNVPMRDMLNDRGLMGDGCIDLKVIRGWMEDAGFSGDHEVEVFSDKYWAMDQKQYLKAIVEAYLKHT